MQEADKKTYTLVSEWLTEYHSTKDNVKKTKTKALIVTAMIPIIKKIAHTIARRSYDPIDDLVQAGSIGLLKAINNYSDKINCNFRIYAGYCIIGEMKHYLRDKLNTIRVPRHIQELAYRINTFTSSLTTEEINNLTSDDVATALDVPARDIDFVMQIDRRKTTISLDGLFSKNSDSLGYEEILFDEKYDSEKETEDAKIILKDVIEKLPEESKKLVKMYYYQDLRQIEISEQLNITPMQVSRKLKKAFSLIYKMIADKKSGV